MKTEANRTPAFQKVGECLYRYSSNGVYYARIKVRGKEFRRSLGTVDRDLAKRRLSALKDEQAGVDHTKGKVTLAELCERYLRTVQHLKPKTLERKTHIVRRIKHEWPTGASCQVTKVRQSDIQLWLAKYNFGAVSRNMHLACLKSILEMAVADGIISRSPATAIASVKLSKPIRETPTWDEFQAIVTDIRAQRFSNDSQESANFVEFLGLAGLGQAETAPLTVHDVNFPRKQITTFRHKTRSGFTIPIYPQLLPVLERIVAVAREEGREKLFRIKDAKKAIAGACRRLGLPRYTHRSFRRMFITRAIEIGVDVKVIAEWQGHKDGGKLILDTYSHVRATHSQKMAELMVA